MRVRVGARDERDERGERVRSEDDGDWGLGILEGGGDWEMLLVKQVWHVSIVECKSRPA